MRVAGGEGAWAHVAAADHVGAAARVGGCAQAERTPLHWAVMQGHIDIAMAFINTKDKVDERQSLLNAKDKVKASVGCVCACVRVGGGLTQRMQLQDAGCSMRDVACGEKM